MGVMPPINVAASLGILQWLLAAIGMTGLPATRVPTWRHPEKSLMVVRKYQ